MRQGVQSIERGETVAARRRTGGRALVRLEPADGPSARAEDGIDPVVKPRRGDEVRSKILRAALECFGAFGFEGTTTRAVAERAGVTHTLVIYHFGSKDQLWIRMMESALSGYVATIEEAMEASEKDGAAASLRVFIEQFVRLSAETPQIHRIMTMESNQGTARLQWVIDHYVRRHFMMIRDLILKGQMEGKVRQGDPAHLYYHIIGAGGTPFTISTEYKALTGRDVFSESEILRTIAFILEIVFI